MTSDWTHWCAEDPDLAVEGRHVVVKFSNARRQKVFVREQDDSYELFGYVDRSTSYRNDREILLGLWNRNRFTRRVGFRVDEHGHLVGESWIPKVGLTANEFRGHVRRTAEECDRLEYLVAGRDQE
ncbi:MAG: hypothetical protein H6684_09375 [Deltaproteobacteria bacterium]|nr:hypothetical protein [Deltaproteobacteria bacterium]